MFALVCVILLKICIVFGILIAFLHIIICASRTSSKGDQSKQDNAAALPSIHANTDISSLKLLPKNEAYLVNGQLFHQEINLDTSSVESYHVIEVYAMENDGDVYCSTPSESGSEFGAEAHSGMQLTLEPVANGFVVNGSCFVTWLQWNTLVTPAVSNKLVHCVVCAQYCEVEASSDHVTTSNHRLSLQNYAPLEKFDLSIIRLIRNQYHCAVCNEIFNVSAELDHIAGKMHEGNLLFALNKASDVLDNSYEQNNNKNKIETYHFVTHAMDRTISDSHSFSEDNFNDNHHFINFRDHLYYDEFEEDAPVFTGPSYATMAKKPKVNTQNFINVDLGNKKVNIRYDSWHMVISPEPNKIWCMVCRKFEAIRNKRDHCNQPEHLSKLERCKVVEAYEEYFIRQVDDKLYHCGHCNNLQLIHEMEAHVESEHPRSKLVADTKNNKHSPLNTDKPQDGGNETSGARNNDRNRNTVNDSPRKVNPNKTNNINLKNIGKNNNIVNDSPKKVYPEKTNINLKNVEQENRSVNKDNDTALNRTAVNNNKVVVDPAPTNQANPNGMPVDLDFTHKMPGIYDEIVIYPFGYKITVPTLSYNIVCQRPKDFYCGLCDVVCEEGGIAQHLYEVRHLELLQRTPFIEPFKYNLIRAIRDALHCTICNIPVAAPQIFTHVKEPHHTEALNKALNQGPKLPPIEKIPVPETPTRVNSFSGAPTPNLSPNSIITSNANIVNQINNVINAHRAANNAKGADLFYNDESRANNINQETHSNRTEVRKERDTYTEFRKERERYTEVRKETKVKSVEKEEEIEDNFENTASEEENFNRTFDSLASEDASFDLEEHVYLKLKNSYIKIPNTSYHTLVHVGDGSRYCFVCATKVQFVEMQKHVDGRPHLENMEKYRFLDKYEDHLLRQIYLMYHCAICNVIITRKELKIHLEWPTHALQNVTLKNMKKTRKTEIKGGVKQIVVSTQKETIYLHDNEPKIKICLNVHIVAKKQTKKKSEATIETKFEFTKKNKIIIFNDNVLKISWESWHGVSKIKNGYKCNLCQRDLKSDEIDMHCSSEWHRYGLDKPFEKQYAPALIRKINESTLNCLFCNTEIANKDHLVGEHLNGKKHAKNFEGILKDSSLANTYTDCHDDVLML